MISGFVSIGFRLELFNLHGRLTLYDVLTIPNISSMALGSCFRVSPYLSNVRTDTIIGTKPLYTQLRRNAPFAY